MNVKFEQLPVNPRCSLQGIGLTHVSDEIRYFGIDGGTSESLHAAFPGPILSEALPVPANDGLRLHDEEGLKPVPPDS